MKSYLALSVILFGYYAFSSDSYGAEEEQKLRPSTYQDDPRLLSMANNPFGALAISMALVLKPKLKRASSVDSSQPGTVPITPEADQADRKSWTSLLTPSTRSGNSTRRNSLASLPSNGGGLEQLRIERTRSVPTRSFPVPIPKTKRKPIFKASCPKAEEEYDKVKASEDLAEKVAARTLKSGIVTVINEPTHSNTPASRNVPYHSRADSWEGGPSRVVPSGGVFLMDFEKTS